MVDLEVPTIFARTLIIKPSIQKYRPLEKNYYVSLPHVKRVKNALYVCRSARRSFEKLRYAYVEFLWLG